MDEPRIIKTTVDFMCPGCEDAVGCDLVVEEDMWVEVTDETIDVYTYLQCPECGGEWEILLKQFKIF